MRKPAFDETSVQQQIAEDVQRCLEVLRAGGLILYPTDTVWGIGCDATNAEAVARVYALKQRPDNKAMIVLLADADQLDHYVVDVPQMARELIEVAVRPLTLVYEGAFNICPALLGDNDSVGIRLTHERFSHRLCSEFGRPIVSTSANISGEAAPGRFADIDPRIVAGVDHVVHYRQDDPNPAQPSNVILLRADGTFKILR